MRKERGELEEKRGRRGKYSRPAIVRLHRILSRDRKPGGPISGGRGRKKGALKKKKEVYPYPTGQISTISLEPDPSDGGRGKKGS